MEYLNFYKQEDVERYLKSIRDGKVDIKDVDQAHRFFCHWIPGEDEHHGHSVWNTNFCPNYLAIQCHTEVGTGINMIIPNIVNNGTVN
jgi:hypothetical protein